MSWPLSQDYNEAIQDPRHSFGDAELKTGEAVTNPLGIPLPRSGNFADVYEVRCPSGSRWAVKCFTRQVSGLSERYSEIGKYLHLAKLPFMVDFSYLEQGIRVRGQWYPILKMQWVEGFVLNEFVRDNLDKKPILQALGQIWLRMARRLCESYIAHCDLQHGNVLFVPGSTAKSLAVKLIDYDGMCVPSLVGTKSGEVGHPAFQHPERLKTAAYDQEVDRFSLLAIATSLRCLAVGGRSLWERYDNGDNLLFRQSDLQSPADSPLFQELLEIPDEQGRLLAKELFRACRGPLDQVPLLTDLIPDERPVAKVVAATATAAPTVEKAVGAKGPDWDFQESESAPALVKKPRASGKTPKWIWGAAAGAAALLLLGVGVGAGLMLRNGPAEKEGAPVARNTPETKKLNATVKPPAPDVKPPPNPSNPPPNPVNPPPTPAPVEKVFALSPKPGRIFVLSPAGDSLAVSDDGDKTWRLVNPRTKKLIREFVGHKEPITKLAFSFDGTRAVTLGGEKMLRLWDLQTENPIGSRTVEGGPVIGMAISADGKGVLTADLGRDVTLWNVENGKKVSWSNDFRKACCVACSPDTRFFVSGYNKSDKEQDGVLFLTHLVSGIESRSFVGPPTRVTALAISTDGKYIVSGQSGEKCLVSIWEAATGKPVKQIPMDNPTGSTIHQVAFSPNGEVVLAASGHRLRAWRVPSGQSVSTPSPDVEPDLVCGGFSPDSKHLLYASRTRDRVDFYPIPVAAPLDLAWDKQINPAGDCTFKNAGGKLTITVPDKPHVLETATDRANSPRVLTDIEGDFAVQVRVGGDFVPTETSSLVGNAWIGAGLLLWVNDGTFLRLERAGWHTRKPSTLYANLEVRQDGKERKVEHNYASLEAAETYLKLERHGNQILAFFSEDGQQWHAVKPLDMELPAKVKVGLLAGSTSTRPFAPTFDQFQIKRGEGELLHANLPLAPAMEPVVVKTPRRRPGRFNNKMAVPDRATLDDKRKNLQERYETEYNKGKPKRTLAATLYEDSGREPDRSMRYAMLSESRDLAAQNGDLPTSLRSVSKLINRFDIDLLESKCRVVEQVLLVPSAKDKSRLLAQKALLFLDRARIDNDFARGERLLVVARAAAKADMSAVLGKMVDQAEKRFKPLREEYDKAKDAAAKLKESPDDPAANLTLGRFCCFGRGDWEVGLPLLVSGSDKTLSEIAQKDVADPAEAAAQAAVGDAWADYADKGAAKEDKAACQRRAYFWYQECLDDLEKKDRTRVKTRLAALVGKQPALNNSFHELDFSGSASRKAGFLHLPPQHVVATRQVYSGPIDIRLTALMKNHLRITFLNGGEMILDAKNRFVETKFYMPYADDPDSQGFGPNSNFVQLIPSSPQQIRIQVTQEKWAVWVNGKEALTQQSNRSFAYAPSPVRVWSDGDEIDLKSLTVKRVR